MFLGGWDVPGEEFELVGEDALEGLAQVDVEVAVRVDANLTVRRPCGVSLRGAR